MSREIIIDTTEAIRNWFMNHIPIMYVEENNVKTAMLFKPQPNSPVLKRVVDETFDEKKFRAEFYDMVMYAKKHRITEPEYGC